MSLKETVKNSKALSAAEKKILQEVLDRKDVPGDVQKLLYNLRIKLVKTALEGLKERKDNEKLRQKLDNLRIEHKHLERRLITNHDTGLPNKIVLDDVLNELLERFNRSDEEQGLVVCFLALDKSYDMLRKTMKPVVCEWVIYRTAERIKELIPKNSHLFHTRTDEFMILLRGIRDRDHCEEIARKLLEIVTDSHRLPGHNVAIGCNLGLSMYPEHGTTKRRLLRNADIALSVSGRSKNAFAVFTKEMSDEVIEKVELQNSILKALEDQAIAEIDKQFEVHYQPIVHVTGASGGKLRWRVKGAEALLRWNHPQKGSISPGRFIPLAEESGLIIPIGSWVLYTVAEQLKKWHLAGYEDLYMSVNLSPRQFKDEWLLDNIQRALEMKKLDPHYLQLEITEGTVMEDPDESIRKLEELHDRGIKISIDDFGTGYSSLNYLRRFPLDSLKIDRSFVIDIVENTSNQGIVRAIISMAKNMDIEVLTEGTEEQDQVEFLFGEDCSCFQGYFFSRPLPLDDYTEFLSTRYSPEEIPVEIPAD